MKKCDAHSTVRPCVRYIGKRYAFWGGRILAEVANRPNLPECRLSRQNPFDADAPPAWLIEIAPQGVVNDDGSTVSDGFDRMADTSRYNRDQARSGDPGHAVNGHLKLALRDLIHFFLGMKMLVNRGATHDNRNARISGSASGNSVPATPASAVLSLPRF